MGLKTLDESLFEAFTYPYCDPQSESITWAIVEGIRRLQELGGNDRRWEMVSKARKEHECARGCQIEQGEAYYKYRLGAGFGDELKFCAGCMAMILYYKQVQNLPLYMDTHWDVENAEAVTINPATQQPMENPIQTRIREMCERGNGQQQQERFEILDQEQRNVLFTQVAEIVAETVAAKLQKAGAAKDEAIVEFVHDIRTPLSNVKLNTDLLALKPGESEKYLGVLRDEIDRMTALIEELRSIAP